MNTRSLQFRLSVWVGFCLAFLGAGLIWYSGYIVRQEAIDKAETMMLKTTITEGKAVQIRFEVAMSAARTVAQSLLVTKSGFMKLSRQHVNAMLRQVLVENPDFLGTYTCWEPDAFDGKDSIFANTPGHDRTGRFIPYWNRGKDGSIDLEPLVGYETPGIGDFYLVPEKTKKETLVEPYKYPVRGVDVFMTSMVVPICKNNKFYGIAGVDFRLEFLQRLADMVEVYNHSGRLFLLSGKGVISGATDRPDLVGQQIGNVPDLAEISTYISSKTDEVFQVGDMLYVCYPIPIGETTSPWLIILQVPEKNVTAEANRHIAVMIIGASLLLTVCIFIIITLLRKLFLVRVLHISDVAVEFASGNLNARCDVAGYDELAGIGNSFNEMATRISASIEQQKQEHALLVSSENLFRIVFNLMPYSYVINDLEGHYIMVNQAFLDTNGFVEEELVGKTVDDLFEYTESGTAHAILETGGLVNRLIHLRNKKNWKESDVLFSSNIIDIGGERRIVTSVVDVTELKRAEAERNMWIKRYDLIVEASGQVAYEYIISSGEIKWGSSIEKVLGYKMDEINGGFIQWKNLLHTDDLSEVINKLEAAEKSCSFWDAYYRMKHLQGHYIWIRDRGFFLPDSSGKAYCQLGMIEDITERKRADDKIIELNSTLEQKVIERTVQLEAANNELDKSNRSLLESNKNLVETLKELNNTQEKLLLSAKMAALGQLIAGIAHEINTPLGAILSSNDVVKDSLIFYLTKTLLFYREADVDSIRLFERLINIAINADPLSDSARENRKRKREFISIAHDRQINDMDRSIESLIETGFRGDAEELIQIIQNKNSMKIINYTYSLSTLLYSSSIIKTAAEKISRFVFALKTYTYHDNVNEKVPVDIIEEIEVVLEIYYNKYKYGVEIIRKYVQIPKIYAYPEKLSQVWINLINNALQALQYNGKLEIEIIEKSDDIIISFTDDGPGISPEIQGKIFTPFFTTKKIGEGTGLGLDICKKILMEIGGTIDFESHPGKTVFTVILKKSGIDEGAGNES